MAVVLSPKGMCSTIVLHLGCLAYTCRYAPATSPDTDTAFLANSVYANLANNASTPQGYYLVFSGLQASTSQSGFSGIKALESYDTFGCQEACDATSGCTAFNIYIERDPSVDPGTNCPNPPSTVNYYCTFWSTAITNTTATNAGQWRGPEDANGQAFHVVTTASNGKSFLPHLNSKQTSHNFTPRLREERAPTILHQFHRSLLPRRQHPSPALVNRCKHLRRQHFLPWPLRPKPMCPSMSIPNGLRCRDRWA